MAMITAKLRFVARYRTRHAEDPVTGGLSFCWTLARRKNYSG